MMRSFLYSIVLVLLPLALSAQQIVEVEYYFDNDPGQGQGEALPIVAGESIDVEYDIDLSSLSAGIHMLYLRVKDESSRWSGLLIRPVYVTTAIPSDPLPTVASMEYYFDTDPGRGLGFPLTPFGDEALVTDGLAGLNSGVHIFYTRVQDDGGNWSAALSRPVYITRYNGSTPSDIVAIHQAITSDGERTDIPLFTDFEPSGYLDLEYQMNLDGMTLASTFTTHLFVEDADGNMSDTVSNTVTFLDNPPTAVVDSHFAFTARPTLFTPLTNDLSEAGDSLSILSVKYAGAGGVVVLSSTIIQYTAAPDFEGVDTLEYIVYDEEVQLDSALIIVTVQRAAPPVLPLWLSGRFLNEDQRWTTPISHFLQFVTYADTTDSLLIWEAISSAHISSEIVSDTLYIVPEANWHGTEITYLVASDGFLADTTELEFAVISKNDSPEPFALLGPPLDTVMYRVNETISDTLVFSWGRSVDVDEDSVTYVFSELSEHPIFVANPTSDTTLSLVPQIQFLAGSPSSLDTFTVVWNVISHDGSDSTSAINGPRTLLLIYDYTVLGVEVGSQLPTAFALHPNYPNPFNPVTTIRFDIPADTQGDLIVYDLMGKEVTTILDAPISAGYHSVQWNGRGNTGRTVPSGVYIARLVTPEYTKSIKMVLLK